MTSFAYTFRLLLLHHIYCQPPHSAVLWFRFRFRSIKFIEKSLLFLKSQLLLFREANRLSQVPIRSQALELWSNG